MTVKKKLDSNFVSVKQNTVEEFDFDCSRCGKKKSQLDAGVAFLPVKTTTRPTSAGRNFVALSFLVNGQYFKDYHKILGTLGLDHVSFTQWIHIVEWIVPFVKRIAEWSVQKARTEAVVRGEKFQFDDFYLTRGHYSSGATFYDAKTGKIILRTLRTDVP